MKTNILHASAVLAIMLTSLLPVSAAEPVKVDTFVRAETDMTMVRYEKQGAFGKLFHTRGPVPIDKQDVIRMNRDTLYSYLVLDLEAGSALVSMPEVGARFMSLQAIDQDHYVHGVFYAPARFVFTREQVGTRYMVLLFRTFLDPNDPADVAAAQAAQDGIRVEQAAAGRLELPEWDKASLDAVRAALNTLALHGASAAHGFGRRGEVNPIDHVAMAAAGWGGNPQRAAMYLPIVPPAALAGAPSRIRLTEVPVDGFWSITMYNAQGFMVANPAHAYSVNNVTAQRAADGSVTVQFGGCEAAPPNCLPTPEGWNAMLRLYRPRAALLEGRWQVPPLEPVR